MTWLLVIPVSLPVIVCVAVKTLLSASAPTVALTPSIVTIGFVAALSASADVRVRVVTSLTVATVSYTHLRAHET